MANAETNALVGLRKLLPKELFYNTDMDMLGAECEEIRIRAGRNVRFVLRGGEIAGSAVATPKLCRDVLEGLSEHSAPAIENELKEGFFTARGGCRVGVCGQMYTKNGLCERLWQISGFNIRIARQIKGCADKIIREVYSCGNAGGLLVLSIPGAGKTTLLRDTVRQLSDGGLSAAIADERGEIAACYMGAPTLDVGERTDVMDMCPKAEGIRKLVRSMSPQLIVTDEIGTREEADALLDAKNCGTVAIASAHASSVEDALRREHIRALIEGGCFTHAAIITGLAAAALIICISMGYMARLRMKDRADKLNALCAEIRTLGDSMELSQYRLSEMLDRLGGELWREYTAALTGEQLGAGEAWAATVQKEADGGSLSGLDKQDIAALITLGEAFSSISRAAQADHARLTLRQMEARAADAEKALMGKGKLYSTLGVLAGFAAALMMI